MGLRPHTHTGEREVVHILPVHLWQEFKGGLVFIRWNTLEILRAGIEFVDHILKVLVRVPRRGNTVVELQFGIPDREDTCIEAQPVRILTMNIDHVRIGRVEQFDRRAQDILNGVAGTVPRADVQVGILNVAGIGQKRRDGMHIKNDQVLEQHALRNIV